MGGRPRTACVGGVACRIRSSPLPASYPCAGGEFALEENPLASDQRATLRAMDLATPSPTTITPRLRVTEGFDKGLQSELSEFPVSIGRAEDNAVRLGCRSVSRHHACIERDDEGFLLRDVKSSYGVRFRGHPVAHFRLYDGSAFHLGDNLVVFEAPGLKAADEEGVSTVDIPRGGRGAAEDKTDPVGIAVPDRVRRAAAATAGEEMPRALRPLLYVALFIVLAIAMVGGYFLTRFW